MERKKPSETKKQPNVEWTTNWITDNRPQQRNGKNRNTEHGADDKSTEKRKHQTTNRITERAQQRRNGNTEQTTNQLQNNWPWIKTNTGGGADKKIWDW